MGSKDDDAKTREARREAERQQRLKTGRAAAKVEPATTRQRRRQAPNN